MKRILVRPDDPVLVKIAQIVLPEKVSSNKIQEIIEEMLDVAYGRRENRDKPTLVGLAAPQVGISKRIILVDTGADGKGGLSNLKVFINPEITKKSKEEMEWYEGCWSTDRVCGIVSRPNKISLRALTRDGKTFTGEYAGYVARIFQHEIDHLNGIEFVQHIIDNAKLHWVEENEFPEYRNHEAWRHWKHLCPREKWEKIKGIKK